MNRDSTSRNRDWTSKQHVSLSTTLKWRYRRHGSTSTPRSRDWTTIRTEITANDAQPDAHSSQIDDQQSQLDALLNKTESQQTQQNQQTDRIDGNTVQPSSLPNTFIRRDCSDVPAASPSGVYILQPEELDGTKWRVPGYCDMETDGGGWTVFQRRADILPREDFYRGWDYYKEGFGDLYKEFWWGLEYVWALISSTDRLYELRVDLEDFEGEKRYAMYNSFRISSESDEYRLTIGNYTGDAGDALTYHNGMRFSTKDSDNDGNGTYSCAQRWKGSWWYKDCHISNLNGLYLAGSDTTWAKGVNWKPWRGYTYSLKTTTMKIRPVKKEL